MPGRAFVIACIIVACLLLAIGRVTALPVPLLAAELFATILGLFVFGSFKYQIASRALRGVYLEILHLFAMAQIAGYALGGCWTHIGSAQSVVGYSFIQRDVDAAFTPLQWIRQMTPIILDMFALITVMIAIESWLF